MNTAEPRPAVERVKPPDGPFRLINPVMRWVLSTPRRAGRVGDQLLLLHLTGRKSGRVLDIPVGYRPAEDGRLLVMTNSLWRVNLRGTDDLDVTLRGVRMPAHAELVEDPELVATAYQRLINQVGHAKAGRRLGIRINVDRAPTHAELAEAAGREGLSVIYLAPTPSPS